MSRRIRTLKPEILEDEKTANLTDAEFRLFVSLILMSDDYGNFRAHVGYVHGVVYWAREEKVPEQTSACIKKLNDYGLIAIYEDSGQAYGHINNWTKHQKVDKPGTRRIPKYPKESGTSDLSTFPREEVANDQGSGIRDQGSGPVPRTSTKDQSEGFADSVGDVHEIFNHYIKLWLEFYSGKGRPPVLSELRTKHINARLKEFGKITCLNAVSGLFASEFHRGNNEKKETWLTPEHVFRSTEQFEKVLKFYRPVLVASSMPNLPPSRPLPKPVQVINEAALDLFLDMK